MRHAQLRFTFLYEECKQNPLSLRNTLFPFGRVTIIIASHAANDPQAN